MKKKIKSAGISIIIIVAKLAPWLWTGRTKEVRTHRKEDDPVGHER